MMNKNIREKIGVALVEIKFEETRLRWYEHIFEQPINVLIRPCETITNTHIN